MIEIEKVQRNIEIGYTMSVYGTHENIHSQMITDIETLMTQLKQVSKLPIPVVIGSLSNEDKQKIALDKYPPLIVNGEEYWIPKYDAMTEQRNAFIDGLNYR